MSATHIPSAEFQFGVAGRNEQVRALVADGRLRRLPVVDDPTKSSAMLGKVTVAPPIQAPTDAAATTRPGRPTSSSAIAEQTVARASTALVLSVTTGNMP